MIRFFGTLSCQTRIWCKRQNVGNLKWPGETWRADMLYRHLLHQLDTRALKSWGISFGEFMWLRLHIHRVNDVYLLTLFKCNLFIINDFFQKSWLDGILTVAYVHVIIITIQCRMFSSLFINFFCVLSHSNSTLKQSQISFCQYRYVDKVIWQSFISRS